MNQSQDTTSASQLVSTLVTRFRAIGNAAVRDLPLYNAALAVEAVGFRLIAQHWVGVLITPWFMNLMRLPEQVAPTDIRNIGSKHKVGLPAGERTLVMGEDEVLGSYECLSLHSPMFAFETQDAARNEALRQLQRLLEPAQVQRLQQHGHLSLEAEPRQISRRTFLGATLSGTSHRCATRGET